MLLLSVLDNTLLPIVHDWKGASALLKKMQLKAVRFLIEFALER